MRGMDLDELFIKAVSHIARIFENEFCKVLQLQPDRKNVFLRAGIGWKAGLVGQAIIDAGADSQAGYTLISEGPVIVKDLRSETRFTGPTLLTEHGVVSGMSVIIHGEDGPWGVMGTHTTRQYNFTDYDVTFFQTISNVLAGAIQRKRGEDLLAQRVAERTKELEDANSLKSEFVNTLSHEVRTPMAGVIGMAECLSLEPLTAEQTEMATHLLSAAQRLYSILNDLLDYSRLESGKQKLKKSNFL